MKKKMTKLFAILLAVSLFCLLLAGCNAAPNFTDEDYESLEIFAVDAADGSNVISVEKYPLWGTNSSLLKSEKTPPETIEVTFEGKTYKGEFIVSTVNMYENYRTDQYRGEDGCSFNVNGQTGELTSISFRTGEGEKVVSEDERKEIALKLAGKYIDTSKYTLSVSGNDSFNHYLFKKQIGGFNKGGQEFCEEWLRIGVSKYGEISSFVTSMLGAYPDRVQDLSAEKQNRLQLLYSDGAREKVLKQVQASIKDSEDVKISAIDAVQYVLLENDTWGAIHGIKIESETSRIEVAPDQYAEVNSNSSKSILVLVK